MYKKLFTVGFVSGVLSVNSIAQCDIANGEKVFKKCVACHSLKEGSHMMGPSLYDLMGRKVGSANGYLYSIAMEQSNSTWDEKQLNKFLENPMREFPGTSMPFSGLRDEADRSDLVCYLGSLKHTY